MIKRPCLRLSNLFGNRLSNILPIGLDSVHLRIPRDIFETAGRRTTKEREKIALLILPDFSLLFSLLFVCLFVACLLCCCCCCFSTVVSFPCSHIYSPRVSKEGKSWCDLLSDCLFPFLCFPGIVCDQDIDRIRSSTEKGKSWRGLLNQKETSIVQQNHTTGWRHCAVFLGKTLYYHSASLPRLQAVSLFFENPGEEHKKVSAWSWLLAWHASGKRWRREPLAAWPSAASAPAGHPRTSRSHACFVFTDFRGKEKLLAVYYTPTGWMRAVLRIKQQNRNISVLIIIVQICPGLNTNEIQIPFKHHKVSWVVKSPKHTQ